MAEQTKKSKSRGKAPTTEAIASVSSTAIESVPQTTDGPMKSVKTAKPSKATATKTASAKPAKVKPANAKPAKAKVVNAGRATKIAPSKAGKALKSAPAAKKSNKPAPSPKTLPKKPIEKASQEADEQPKTAQILDSQVVYEGPLFRVVKDHLIEPDGTEARRDVIRHNGSIVILAVDGSKKSGKPKKDPWVVIERQYRHAAGQFLWELPAGKLEAGEEPLEGAKRELAEETGYSAQKWSPLVEYYASPGFLGEAMKVFLAEGLIAGDAHPEEDEHIDFRLVKLSELLAMAEEGKIIDGKTLTSILLYSRLKGNKSASKSKK